MGGVDVGESQRTPSAWMKKTLIRGRHDRQPARLRRPSAQAQGRAVDKLDHGPLRQFAARRAGEEGLGMARIGPPPPDGSPRRAPCGSGRGRMGHRPGPSRPATHRPPNSRLDCSTQQIVVADGSTASQPAPGMRSGRAPEPITPAGLARDEGPVLGPVEDLETIRLDLGLDRADGSRPRTALARRNVAPGRPANPLLCRGCRRIARLRDQEDRQAARRYGIAIASIGYAASSRATLVLDSSQRPAQLAQR